MKKLLSVLLVLSAILLVSSCSSSSTKMAGIYHCANWRNSGESVIFINADGSCSGPFVSGKAQWKEEGDIIKITAEQYSDETAYIVDEGIVYGSHFFKKIK